MSGRDAILDAVGRNKPAGAPLPTVPRFAPPPGATVERFRTAVAEVGGAIVDVEPTDVAAAVANRYPDATVVGCADPELMAAPFPLHATDDPHALDVLEVLVCRGVVGVAENGAIWVPESRAIHRAAPFLTHHLVIVLDERDIVENMHDAYAHLRVDAEDFGVFIAGPSKTADIEQVLVIGAHGPRSLTVFLQRNPLAP